ncbi:MAG: class I SAM-dependent methyltransferase [Treponema sp.]|nr:class I SAM-dependent methyltransferase [Treponema sp.]
MPVSEAKSEDLPCAVCGCSIFNPSLNCEGFSFVRCKSCGLVQRNPQPVKEEIISRYSKMYGNDYLAYEIENEAAFLKLQQLALKDAGFEKLEKMLFARNEKQRNAGTGNSPSVLDIGCATGAVLNSLRERGWHVTGVEISPAASYAQKKRNLDVRNLPLEENNFPLRGFDAILASHLIEHLNDPRAFFTEINRILKDDGYVFITTPNISGFQARLFGSRWRSAIFDHLYLFSVRTLKRLLSNTGFKTESCRTWGGLAAGTSPKWLKKAADFLAKRFNCGDVMIIRAVKNHRIAQ